MDNLERAERTIRNFSGYISKTEALELYETLMEECYRNRLIIIDSVPNNSFVWFSKINRTRDTKPIPATKEEIEMLKEAGLDMFMFDV